MGNNDIKVRDLADTSSITTDNQMMVLTDDANNTVKNIKVEDLITNIISGDNNNSIIAGTDKKLYAADPTNKIGNLANLTTTNKSNLVAAINELDSDIGSTDTNIGDLANLNTTDKTSVVNAINEVLASPIDNDLLHALKGYEDEGKLLSNPELYNDVYSYAHSTFDSSKFSPTGTQSITNDGIITSSGTANYLTLAGLTIDNISTYKICITFTTPSTLSSGGSVFRAEEQGFALYCGSAGIMRFYYRTSANSEVEITTFRAQASTSYDVFYETNFTTREIVVGYKKSTDANYTTETTTADSLLTNSSMRIFNSTEELTGNIKKVVVYKNGYPVFSGNKTGIDTVKPDDYTVVGTPTISADGVASGFSASNYLTKDLNLSGSDLKIRVPFKITNVTKTQQLIINSNFQLRLLYVSASTALYPSLYITDGVNTAQPRTSNYSIQANTDYVVEIEYKHNVSVEIKLYSASGVLLDSLYSTTSGTPSAVIPNSTLTTAIGSNAGSDYLEGSIDLSGVKIEADFGVYRPTIIIPYNESSTGSKIVDVAYRDRVIDVYNLYGSALYYTIDETNKNVTLPMGSVYGFIQKAPDGQWINAGSSNISVTTVTEVNSYTIDLSSILPADGHTYECVFRYNIERRDSSSNDTGYKITSSSGKVWVWEHVEGDPQLSTNYVRKSGQFVAIVDTSRSLTLEINETALNSSGLDLIMYRRCGGNY